MLQLNQIRKNYVSGDLQVKALDGVSLSFRETEFVSILGPSGSGKTTLLNIIGGLDQYTSGDLIINGRSTREFRDRDWDSYRNHRIGFVFQSYNLIPHQSVLANVELALTLSGVGKAERRKRATEALQKVGLGDQLRKRPSQMSGGQMQRVAIARALVNNPDILLADEPTGALDTQTSVQIMEILREISRDKLVIMVTHNPELAKVYSTRIVRMQDGQILSDTDPYDPGAEQPPAVISNEKTSMSFGTALSLSLNNLMTKKGRTILTSFAGSIGIIGIALILSLSNGVQEYINGVQEDTLASYPIQLEASTVDLTSMLASASQMHQSEEHDLDKIYSSNMMGDMTELMQAEVQTNNLSAFKDYLTENEETVMQYANEITYRYGVTPMVYTTLEDGSTQQVNPSLVVDKMGMSELLSVNPVMSAYSDSYNVFTELRENENLRDASYELLSGSWPESYDEAVLIISPNNEISDYTLYTLGIKPLEEVEQMMNPDSGETFTTEDLTFTYDEWIGKTFSVVPSCDLFDDSDGDGVWTDHREDADYISEAAANGVQLKITGVVRETERSSSVSGGIGYTHELTEYLINAANDSEVVAAQKANPDTDILTGKPFESAQTQEPEQTEEDTQPEQQPAEESSNEAVESEPASEAESETAETPSQTAPTYQLPLTDEQKIALSPTAESMGMDPATMTDSEWQRVIDVVQPQTETQSTEPETSSQPAAESGLTEEQKVALSPLAESMGMDPATMTDSEWMQVAQAAQSQQPGNEEPAESDSLAVLEEMGIDPSTLSEEQLAYLSSMSADEVRALMESYAAPTSNTYDGNLSAFGAADFDSPTSIELIPKSFADKEELTAMIEDYNDLCRSEGREEDTIDYTDMVGLLMSSVTTIINAISYILIAFVGISLVVSSIMIGIITYISVLERTKEIGVLRAIGASKHDISSVFNAETLIIGFGSGALGIIVTLLLLIPINMIIDALTGIAGLAALPPVGAVILVAISMLLTFISGLIPSKMAARKDPVEALRSE